MKELFSLKRAVHGPGTVLSQWDPTGRYLATFGVNRKFHLFDRTGTLLDSHTLSQQKPTLQLEWSATGSHCAIIQDQSSVLVLYTVHQSRIKEVETGLKDGPSYLTWSKQTPALLAIGSMKGNLVLYNTDTHRSVTVAGKHSKRITCGQWNTDNLLSLAALDRMLTISDDKGELKEQAKLKYDPSQIQFASQKDDSGSGGKSDGSGTDGNNTSNESTVSINMGRQTILLYNMHDSDNPVELAFQSKYGEIVRYHWFGDGYLMIGFSRGYVIAISTHMKEIGEELQSLKLYESALTNLCYSPVLQRLAVCGDDGIKVVDMSDWKEIKTDQVRFTQDEGDVESMEWTEDGQILTVNTTGGYVLSYLTSIPQLSAAYQNKLAYLSSLRSVSVFDAVTDSLSDSGTQFTIDVATEPTFLSLGPTMLVCGMNNHAWFYDLNSGQCVTEKTYMGSVKALAINDNYAAILYDGKLLLHSITNTHPNSDSDGEDRIFPLNGDDSNVNTISITSLALTKDYLIYSTNTGTLHCYSLTGSLSINEYRHDSPIIAVFPNTIGTRIVFIDSHHKGYYYSPVDDHCVDIPSFPTTTDTILFDVCDNSCFVAVDAKLGKNVVTFIYTPQSTKGPTVTKLTNTKLPYSFVPVLFHDGSLHGQKASGALTSLLISSHDALSVIQKGSKRTPEKLRQGLTQLLALNRLKQAWDIACVVKQKEQMLLLARKACDQLDIDLAIRVYREMKETSMVTALLELNHIEDKQLLAGHICLLSGDYNRASTLFLASSEPTTALTMRRDLLQWDQALKLALTVAPQSIPSIAREYAQQLEVKGDYNKALDMYQKCYTEAQSSHSDYEANRLSSSHGIARMTLRLGDLQRGQSLALQSKDRTLLKECATILESMKQYNDAADMFVHAEHYEKAAALYCQIRSFSKAAPLMSKITAPKIHALYAAAKESEGDYSEAIKAYEKAKDSDSVIRLYLNHLNDPERAFDIARKTKSSAGSELIAKYCVQHLNVNLAIEFLFLANRHEEAFTMAKQYNAMDVYAQSLGDDNGSIEQYSQLALYYEQRSEFSKAAHYYHLLNDYQHALKLYLLTPTPISADIYSAIEVVKAARQSSNGELLVRQLHDYLIGDSDGIVKDLNYIFRLYLALGDYKQAASTAILIATQEQLNGAYSAATAILVDIAKELHHSRVIVPHELSKQLLLLHSYRLAKLSSQRGDHESAARMLLRLTKHVSHFPKHSVPILTSTVIECHRSGLKRSAYEVASTLQRPEYRSLIDAKYKKPIESIVRRPTLTEEVDELQTPCPYCQYMLPRTMTECINCHNEIPWCLVTGQHLISNDWTQCGNCRFHALYSEFSQYLSQSPEAQCPMCQSKVNVGELKLLSDDEVQAVLYPKEEEVAKTNADSSNDTDNESEIVTTKVQSSVLAVKRGQDASAAYSSALDIEVKF